MSTNPFELCGGTSFRPTVSVLRCLLVAGLAIASAGCSSDEAISADAASGVPGDVALSLRQMERQYARCSRYSDRARVHLEYDLGGQRRSETSDLQLDFQRPNRLSLQIHRGINRLRMVSDGRTMWVALEDPLTKNMRGQIVRRIASPTLTVDEVYAATELVDPMRPQEMLSVLLGLPLDLQRSPLGLLTASAAWQQLLKEPRGLQILPDQAWRGHACRRLRLPSPAGDGDYLFWIDSRLGVLRRLDFPTGQLFQQVPEPQRPQNVALWIEMDPIELDGADRTALFSTPPPKEATLVQHFVLPPLDLPSTQFGQVIPAFALHDLEGNIERSGDWGDRIVVLAWFQDHPTCRAFVPRLDAVAKQLPVGAQRVLWRLVCTESSEKYPADQLRQLMASWGTRLPLLRDQEAVGRDLLKIDQAPTVVVLDGRRRLQLFEVGANPSLPSTLTAVLTRLLNGEDVAGDVLRNFQAETQAYEQRLQLARHPAGEPLPIAAPPFPPASEPNQLQRRLRWQNRELSAPGNLLVIGQSPSTLRLVVLDQMQQAVELDSNGRVVQRHVLAGADRSPITQLRWAGNSRGEACFVGFARLGQKMHVYDQQFRLLFSYPDSGPRHAGIMDVEVVDLDNDGRVELYVGFADPVGVHRLELDGKRRWSNRAAPGVVSLVARRLARPPYLLATGEQGVIVPISRSGGEGPAISVGQRTIHQLAANPTTSPRPTQFLGMSYTVDGRSIAVGLTPELREAWSYGLPGGVYSTQVQTPIWAQLLKGESGQWLLAGPDGSVHLIDDSGEFFDSFHVGHAIEGLAGFQHRGQGVLVITGGGAVTAYDIGRPAAATATP